MKTGIVHIIIFFLNIAAVSAQFGVGSTFEELPADSLPKLSTDWHSGFRPQTRTNEYLSWKQSDTVPKNYFFIAPAVDVNGAYSNQFNYRAGLGLNLQAQVGKWYFKVGALGGIGSIDSVFNTPAFYYEQKGKNYYYADVRARVSYTHNQFFNFQIGLDNHFIGEGNRSLFLSDYGVPHPFAQIKTKFWRLEYTVLYQFMREQVPGAWKSKFATTHHVSLNATKWLNFGVFETVLFQPKDTLLNRGFEVEYLNPVIFFRPQEYSIGSSDNVLVGFSMDAKFLNQVFYSQFLIDEFSLLEIKKKTKWWAIKYGLQAGIKGRFNTRIGELFYRTEFNMMRPFTYSHVDAMQTYGNQGHVLAHPMGANFYEILGELKWQKGKYLAKFFTSYSFKGNDKDGFSYGGNIYQPYTLRPEEYGFYIGRGKGANLSRTILTFDYEVYKPMKLHAFLEQHLIINGNTLKSNYIPVIGIRSQLWNDYRNY